MADWIDIQDSAVDPDAPVTSELAYAFRDNPIAITEGASGAPRIQDGALGGTATGYGSSWVGDRSALLGAGTVGSYVFATRQTGASGQSFGQTVSGSNIIPADAGALGTGLPLNGTWRCMGIAGNAPGVAGSTTLWLRIS